MRYRNKLLTFAVDLVAQIPPEIAQLARTLALISTACCILAWIAVGIGYFMGWFKIALPIPSRKIKGSGHEDVETAGLAAFFIPFFTTLITIILWVIASSGGQPVTPPTS